MRLKTLLRQNFGKALGFKIAVPGNELNILRKIAETRGPFLNISIIFEVNIHDILELVSFLNDEKNIFRYMNWVGRA